ncbi:MAG: hypothetical protein KF849_08650 [Rhizobiaceae bacterium]|nr:hypothetical protein [Rhizobiaceae bacterium]
MAFHAGWDKAPSEAPEGWPYNLRQIQVMSAGVDKYPAWFFGKVPITCGRGVSAVGIAEYTMTAIAAREKRWVELSRWRKGEKSPTLRGIAGKTLGLLGLGAIGGAVARRALAFDMKVLAFTRSGKTPEGLDVEMTADLAELMARSDHLVVAAPMTPYTNRMLDASAFAAAKPGLHLINISRGEIVDNEALLRALDGGVVGFATLDVTAPEPLPDGHPLAAHPNVMVTPHISWMAEDNFERLLAKTMRDLDRYVRGEPPLDLVDPDARY